MKCIYGGNGPDAASLWIDVDGEGGGRIALNYRDGFVGLDTVVGPSYEEAWRFREHRNPWRFWAPHDLASALAHAYACVKDRERRRGEVTNAERDAQAMAIELQAIFEEV